MTAQTSTFEPLNQVSLRGVLAAAPVERELPSGDQLISFRITVKRPADTRARVDSIDCSSTRPVVRRALARYAPGQLVEITGSLRRRFWRGPAGVASRYEVDVASIKMLRVTRPRSAERRDRTPASA